MINLLGIRLSLTKLVIIIFLLFFAFVIILNSIDLFYPQKSFRLGLITKLGINIKDGKLLKALSPKTTELNAFDTTGLYFYLKDQKTFEQSRGYACSFIGQIEDKQDKQITVMADNNQKFILVIDTFSGLIKYYLRVPFYDEKTGEWQEYIRIAELSDFNNGDKVLVTWDCPTENPEDMFESDSKMVKEEYLNVKPLSLSKRI